MAETVSKLDAARRQLRVAIRMYFEGADALAIHSLTNAAHELLRDLLKPTAAGGSSKDLQNIPLDLRRDWSALLGRLRKFLDHPDRGVGENILFDARITEILLYDACKLYRQVAGRMLLEGRVFVAWFLVRYPDSPERHDGRDPVNALRADGPAERGEFLAFLNDAAVRRRFPTDD